MILALLSLIRGWPALDRLLDRVAGHFTTWPADEFSRFTTTPIGQPVPSFAATAQPPAARPLRPPEPESLAPQAFEKRFTRLQREGKFEDMWAMLAEDAQRSWGSEERFVRSMKRLTGTAEVLGAEVGTVDIVPEWTDQQRNRTYHNVARLAVNYRLKLDWRELTVSRQVHLIPAADGWRTLFYPAAS